jgi:hypothetical protein
MIGFARNVCYAFHRVRKTGSASYLVLRHSAPPCLLTGWCILPTPFRFDISFPSSCRRPRVQLSAHHFEFQEGIKWAESASPKPLRIAILQRECVSLISMRISSHWSPHRCRAAQPVMPGLFTVNPPIRDSGRLEDIVINPPICHLQS